MNRLSMDLSELTLTPSNFDEETWLTGPENGTDNTDGDEDLGKWLQGAVRKVDFRTRSALSRRLEKKKQKHETKELRGTKDFNLAAIEECDSDREKHKEQRRTLSVRQQNNIMGTDEDDDLFFDAPSGEADQTANSEAYVTPRESHAYSSLRSVRKGDSQGSQSRVNRVSSFDTLIAPHRDISHRNLVPPSMDYSDSSETPEDPLHISPKPTSLEEIERKAREQEKELRMECTSANRRHRGSSPANSDCISHRSRPTSLVLSLLSQLLAINFKLRQETMGVAVFLLLVVAAGAAYHLGYLDVYVEQVKQKINEAQQKQR
ncbi:hypothetical protein Ddc_05920 [Ditylenchus destructor]|nr:hypothetical protein Ddc_05920 [Ditylenchus destructor]